MNIASDGTPLAIPNHTLLEPLELSPYECSRGKTIYTNTTWGEGKGHTIVATVVIKASIYKMLRGGY